MISPPFIIENFYLRDYPILLPSKWQCISVPESGKFFVKLIVRQRHYTYFHQKQNFLRDYYTGNSNPFQQQNEKWVVMFLTKCLLLLISSIQMFF